MRLANDDDKVSLALNTSRINKFSKKNSIKDFLSWSYLTTKKINAYSDHSSFLSIFAEPVDFEKLKDTLIPIAILFLFSKLIDDYDRSIIDSCEIIMGERRRKVNLIKIIKRFENIQQIVTLEQDEKIIYQVTNNIVNDIKIKINKKSITFDSSKLKNVILNKTNGNNISIVDYLNRTNQFIVNFESANLIYSNRKLFRDSKLLGNIDYFMKIFRPYEQLKSINSEKGSFTTVSTSFDSDCLFGFVENQLLNDYNYVVCDDLIKEWADHIAINENKISFYHSKYKDAKYSASAFQDIIGQALKNIGNMTPQPYQLQSKIKRWSSNYNNDKVKTNISRLRKGVDVLSALAQFEETLKNPNLIREINLVINFISKSGLEKKLQMLKDGDKFRERNEVIQILWFISSLISGCTEAGVDVYINCIP